MLRFSLSSQSAFERLSFCVSCLLLCLVWRLDQRTRLQSQSYFCADEDQVASISHLLTSCFLRHGYIKSGTCSNIINVQVIHKSSVEACCEGALDSSKETHPEDGLVAICAFVNLCCLSKVKCGVLLYETPRGSMSTAGRVLTLFGPETSAPPQRLGKTLLNSHCRLSGV